MSERPLSVAGVLLAAGRGERFGSNKLLYDLDGRPLVTHALSSALASRLPKIYTVVDATDPSVERVIDSFVRGSEEPMASSDGALGGHVFRSVGRRIEIIRNPDPSRGMMSSVKLGLKAIATSYGAAMIVLADMPYVSAATINALARSFEATGRVVVPVCEGRLRHPRVVPRHLFWAFYDLDDDGRGQRIFETLGREVVRLEVDAADEFTDIDTRGDVPGHPE